MTLPEIAVKRPIATTMALLSLLVLGLVALSKLELAFMPEAESKELFVIVNYHNASPKAIERMIIKPLEDALSSLNGLEYMRSNSDNRGGRIILSFALTANIDLARAEVHERIDRARHELPEDLEQILIAGNWNPRETGETILEARLSSGRDLSQSYELLERKIVKPLERIPGVAMVGLDGVNPREVRVNLDLNQLKRHQLDPRQIWADIASNSKNTAIGLLRPGSSKIVIRSLGRLTSIDQIKALPLTASQLTLADVAEVSYREPPLEYGRHLDGDFAIGLNIAKESSANTVVIADQVHQRIAQMQSDPELDGINFLVWQDQGKEIRNTLGDLQQTGLFGALLASLVLYLFLRNLGATLIAVVCIPFSLVVACGVIWLQGKNLNTISLLGLIVGLGMLVDNAVVVMENIDRFQHKGYSSKVAAILGAKEVSVAVMTATLTSIIVFLPIIFSKPTHLNVILQELGMTICITLTASLLISQTLIPLAVTRLKAAEKKRVVGRSSGRMSRFLAVYTQILKFTLRHPWLAIITGVSVLGATAYPALQLNYNLEPQATQMFVQVNIEISEPITLSAKEDLIVEIEQSLRPHQAKLNVKSIYTWWSEDHSVLRFYMQPGFQNEDAMNQLRQKLPAFLPTIPGVKLRVADNGPFWMRNSGKRVAVELRGPDTEVLGQLAEKALVEIADIPGLFDFYSTSEGGQLELHSYLNRERMASYGVASNQPANRVEMTFRGRNLPRYQDGNSEVDMRLLLNENQQTRVEDLKNMSISKPDGSEVNLESIADFEVKKGPARVNRQNKIASIWVGGRFNQGRRYEYQQQLMEQLAALELPKGYYWESNGFRGREEDSQKDFILNLCLALGLIYAVMAGLFESMRQALALMISLPFALAGAFWTLFAFQIDFDQPASIAVLLLLGIVVNNGIVMIEHINLYRREGWPREQAMVRGCNERLRPIIMTALTTLVGLVPIIIQQPALGGVYYYSMAYVIIGGLLLSTLLTSIFLPATICVTEDLPKQILAGLGGLHRAMRGKNTQAKPAD